MKDTNAHSVTTAERHCATEFGKVHLFCSIYPSEMKPCFLGLYWAKISYDLMRKIKRKTTSYTIAETAIRSVLCNCWIESPDANHVQKQLDAGGKILYAPRGIGRQYVQLLKHDTNPTPC